jgi:hypothetical protein
MVQHVSKSGFVWKDARGTSKYEMDMDEARKYLVVSAALGVLLEKMPEHYLTMDAAVKYISASQIGYNQYFIRETFGFMVAEGSLKINLDGYIKKLTEGESGMLTKRAKWLLAMPNGELDRWEEGGIIGKKRSVFRDFRNWYNFHERSKTETWGALVERLRRGVVNGVV